MMIENKRSPSIINTTEKHFFNLGSALDVGFLNSTAKKNFSVPFIKMVTRDASTTKVCRMT